MRFVLHDMRFIFLLSVLVSLSYTLFVATPVHAVMVGEETASLVTSPRYPEPRSTITVSLDAYTVDTTGASIAWYVDGKEVSGARNARSFELTTGALGTSQTVRADIVRAGGFPLTVSRAITPMRIDLITEAMTYVPAFYKGRSLPGEDLPVHFVALPHNGSGAAPSTFTYRWELDTTVLFGGPVKGKYAIDITMPRYAEHTLGVSVIDAAGKTVGESHVILTASEPELYFYEYSALRGISDRALLQQTTIVGDEMTVYGEPYYIAPSINPEAVGFTWSIDNEDVATFEDPHALTLRKSGGSGTAQIELEALTKTQIPKYLRESFTIMF